MRTRRHCLLLITMVLLPLGTALAQEGSATELAQRLLGPWGADAGITAQIIPGELPAGLDVDLPVPSSLRLVGSFANYNTDDGEFIHGQVVFDSPLTSQDSLMLIEGAFSAAGWNQQRQPEQVGFQPANPHVSAVFCAPEGEAQVYLNAFPLPGGTTDVRYELSGDTGYDPCAPTEYWPGPQVPLPQLPAPAGSSTNIHGTNWYEDEASSSAIIEVDMSEAQLHDYLAGLLEQNGWARAEEPDRSLWLTTEDERDWLGILQVSELTAGRFFTSFAAVRMDR